MNNAVVLGPLVLPYSLLLPADKVAAWLRARKLALRNALVDEHRKAGAEFKQRALPTTLFFDAEGRLVSTRVGKLSSATLSERLQTPAR